MAPIPFAILSLLLLAITASAEEDWANCSPCKCSWVSGRKNADCKRSPSTMLSSIPKNLSSEIRSIDFTEQQFYTLDKRTFYDVKLGDLQKIKLVSCHLTIIDKLAFKNMELLIELDMSRNEISKLDPDTFRDNKRLRVLRLNENKIERLEDGLFTNLTFLQKVELNDNHIMHIGKAVFVNTPMLQYILLNSNQLKYMDTAVIEKLYKLGTLNLHNNSWICDCHLKSFRDLTITRNLLVSLPTECEEPQRLKGRSWSDLSSEDFACRPRIMVPPNSSTMLQVDSENVTLYCKVKGNPRPDVNWVYKNVIIDSNPRRPGGHRFLPTSAEAGEDTYWYNLTILSVTYHDSGEYKCTAKNPGGVQERNLTLKISKPSLADFSANSTTWTLILFIILGLVLLALLITVFLWCCLCRPRTVRNSKGNSMSPNGDICLMEGTGTELEKSLITEVNPVEKPPRQYPPSVASGVTEVSEVNRTLLDNESVFAQDNDSRSFDFVEPTPRKSQNLLDIEHVRVDRPYPPDLLSFPARGIHISPAGSSASTVPDQTRLPPQHGPQSPIHSPLYETPGAIYRTLPYSRSHSPFTSPLSGPIIVPRSSNKGYVTMPRRNRVPSWSSAPPSTPLLAEPVYDNLGLRTTAEGSSMLSLNKAGNSESTPRPRPSVTSVTSGINYPPQTPVKCVPIEELEQPLNGGILQRSTHSLSPDMNGGKRDSWIRMNPEGSSQKSVDADPRRLSNASLASVPEGRKVPPRPPPKPKKSVTSGPLFEDEGEDGTEV